MIIACDTSSAVCSVAISDQGSIKFEREAKGAQIHIEKLAPFLEEALAHCSSEGKPPSALGIAIGPGSFNGLRIGLSTLKALAVSLRLALIPVYTTDAMAYGIRNDFIGSNRAVIFSHRDYVHYADYYFDKSEQIMTPEFKYGSWNNLYDDEIEHYFGTADRGFAEWLKSEQGEHVGKKFIHVAASAAPVALLAELHIDQIAPYLDDLEPFFKASYEAKKWVAPKF